MKKIEGIGYLILGCNETEFTYGDDEATVYFLDSFGGSCQIKAPPGKVIRFLSLEGICYYRFIDRDGIEQ